MLNLSADEQAWVDESRRQMGEQFPALLEDIIIFEPYSRGISDPEVDMFTLALIKGGTREKKDAVADLGYYVDLDTTMVSPTLTVRTIGEWEEAKHQKGWIYRRAHNGISAP